MKPTLTLRKVLPALVVISLGAVIAMGMAPQDAKPGDKRWTTNVPKAIDRAKAEKVLLLVDFNASWCGPCQSYKREVFPTKEFADATKDIILVDVDVDSNESLVQKYKVEGIPDIRIYSSDSKLLSRVVGFGKKDLFAAIKKAKNYQRK